MYFNGLQYYLVLLLGNRIMCYPIYINNSLITQVDSNEYAIYHSIILNAITGILEALI